MVGGPSAVLASNYRWHLYLRGQCPTHLTDVHMLLAVDPSGKVND